MQDESLLQAYCNKQGFDYLEVLNRESTYLSEDRLISLDLSRFNIKNIPYEMLKEFSELSYLDLSNNTISELNEIPSLPSLLTLNLSRNPIKTVSDVAFRLLTSLSILNLEFRGENLSIELFEHIPNLSILQFKYNNRIAFGMLHALKRLRSLSIVTKQSLDPFHLEGLNLRDLTISSQKRIHQDCFISLGSLIELRIIDNEITMLPREVFHSLSELKILDLSHNNIKKLYPDQFEPLTALEELDLSFNRIQDLPSELFSKMYSLQSLRINENPLSAINLQGVDIYY